MKPSSVENPEAKGRRDAERGGGVEQFKTASIQDRPWAPLLVAVGAAVIYAATPGYDLLRWDDNDYVTDNAVLRLPMAEFLGRVTTEFVPAPHGDFLPVTLLSYWLEYRAVGVEAWLYHLDNVLIFAAGCAALWFLLARITERKGLALIVTLVFAAHPLNCEAVAWVSERKSVLSFLLCIGAMILAIPAPGRQKVSWRRHYGSLALYVLACLSKSAVVFFPLLIWAYRWIIAGKSLSRSVVHALPYCVPALATALLRIKGHALSGQADMRPFEDALGYHPWYHGLTILSILGRYGKQILFPVDLSHCYPLEVSRSAADPYVWMGVVILVGAIAGIVLLRRRVRLASFGLVWFLAGWLPHMQIQPIPPAMRADRYMFYALPGLILAVVVLIDRSVAVRWQLRLGRPLAVAGLGMAILLGITASRRATVWADDLSLWRDGVSKAPDSVIANSHYGYQLLDLGQFEEAETHFRRALSRSEGNFMSLNGMATVLAHRGDTAGAVRLLRNSLNDAQAPPSRRGQTWALIGKYELGRGNMKASRSAYSRAVELRPEDHTVRTGWALAAVLSGKASESLGHLEAALELAPNDPAALYVYSMALGELGRPEEALELARRCIAVAPEYALAYEQAGRICMKTGKWSEAVGYLEELVRLLPNDPRAAELLGRAREK